ncbi:hypothetical protein ACFQU9_16320 [Actinomadura namibiensis]|uniref:Integral membrane protein n=1 Tax=Actinomadura namibiensis TaxID=182080 RepID=A0A7W3LS73_ACTNM|nr:hypothetical protein [Actinomadura namibiensis]MBA8953289.1 hypothetical protein [Actinomadura namibiensis]
MAVRTAPETATAPSLFADGRRFLKLALRVDAVVTGANGLAYLALAGPLERLLGLDAAVGRGLGAFLVVFAIAVAALSMPARAPRLAVHAVIEMNVLWSVLSVVAVATGWLDLNAVGATWAVMQAGTVGAFAAAQFIAIRRAD